MLSPELYPWHTPAWETWMTALQRDRLAHAWLVHGCRGLQKHELAKRMAALLLCERTPQQALHACGDCRSCLLLQNHHPNLIAPSPAPDSKSQALSIDAVRDLQEKLMLGAGYASRQVVLINAAENLTLSAGNALLKILEEPPNDAVFILVSSEPALLPATLRSRCRHLRVSLPTPATFSAWLQQQQAPDAALMSQLSAGVPGIALEWLAEPTLWAAVLRFIQQFNELLWTQGDVVAWVTAHKNWPLPRMIELLLLWLNHAIRSKMSSTISSWLGPQFHALQLCDIPWLYQMVDRLYYLKQAALRGQSLNQPLQLTSLLLDWQSEVARRV